MIIQKLENCAAWKNSNMKKLQQEKSAAQKNAKQKSLARGKHEK